VEQNIRLAGFAASRFRSCFPHQAAQIGGWDDLFQYACVALAQAALAYDADRGYPFPSYATRYIFHRLQSIANLSGHIRIPEYHTGEARAALVKRLSPHSLDREPERAMPEDLTMAQERAALARAVRRLARRHARVLLMRRRGKALAEIAERLGGLSRQRAHRLLIEAIEEVRTELRKAGWEILPQTKKPRSKRRGQE
jgi:RNA polymerase sigma factor (sigma-70 family)